MNIAKPYLLFLGDVADDLAAKTAHGIVDWRPHRCVGQLRLDGCKADCGLDDITLAEAAKRGLKTDFRATGQTGVLIASHGIAIDAVVADFISGAAEWLSPANDADHWDVIEGQGSLFHPSFAGVTLGLLHGSQPDAFVVCHEPTRTGMRGVKHVLPSIAEVIEHTVLAGRLTNPAIAPIGIAINTEALDDEAAKACLEATAAEHGLPAVDPIRTGVGLIVDELQRRFP